MSVVYGCKITSNNAADDSPHYIGLTEKTFKDRLYKHKSSFKYETKKNSIELSNYAWGEKKDKQKISFKWYIKERAKAYSPVTKRCMLCLSEKFHILFSKERLLNKRNEIISNIGTTTSINLAIIKFNLMKIVTYGFNELMYF